MLYHFSDTLEADAWNGRWRKFQANNNNNINANKQTSEDDMSIFNQKKHFHDYHKFFFFCQIKLNNLFSSDNLLFWVSDY